MANSLQRFTFDETPEETARIMEAAALLREHPRVGVDPKQYASFRPTANGGIPSLLLEDFSDIPFLDGIDGIEWYQLRSRTRAGDGDYFAATQNPVAGYEDYNREHLEIGAPNYLQAKPADTGALGVADACREDPTAFKTLETIVDEKGGLRLHPYMGSRSVWRLAEELKKRTGGCVEVLGPTPPAVFAANHKGLLDRAVRILFGDKAVCRTAKSKDARTLARAASQFTGAEKIALKMVDYASAMGNAVYSAAELFAGTEDDIVARIRAFMEKHRWNGQEEILMVEWRTDSRQSPSSQLWIPPLGEGAPRVDGIFEQLLDGDNGIFQGSLPSSLPPPLQERIARMSLQAGRVFQELGYTGRCSFDFILCGDDPIFVECNGRWGGTSIPMALLERIFGEKKVPFYRARDYVDSKLAGRPFPEILARLKDSLYDARTGNGHFILYNVGCLRDSGKFDVIALGATREESSHRLEQQLPDLL